MAELILAYSDSTRLRELTAQWDAGVAGEAAPTRHLWTDLTLLQAARGATIAGSTGVEGNPLRARQVDQLLAGGRLDAPANQVTEVVNYNLALELANIAALRTDFEWSQELLRRLNAQVLDGLEDDEHGEYRTTPVNVGGRYDPPPAGRVPELVRGLVGWLREPERAHPLIDTGLLHLNLVSIHPWLNGNGRTTRVATMLQLMRRGVSSPELVNIESWLRVHRDEYTDALQEAGGQRWDPEERSATVWLEFYAGVAVSRLGLHARILAAVPGDIGLLAMILTQRGEPLDWAAHLLAATATPLRTSSVARLVGLSDARMRAILGAMAAAGWLVPVGERRARRYEPAQRLLDVPLRVPELLDLMRDGGDSD